MCVSSRETGSSKERFFPSVFQSRPRSHCRADDLGCPDPGSLPSFLDAADGIGRVDVIGLCGELIASRSVSLSREDVVL
jgi:hypothetical protein